MESEIRFDENGLLPAVVQDRLTGQVRMVGWMNREAVARTLESGKVTFYSRSRGKIWEKGETSGNHLLVRSLFVDCDADTLLVLVDPVGPTCHTGRPSCFFRRLDAAGLHDEPVDAGAFLDLLENEILSRRESTAEKSYTKSLLVGGPAKIAAKLAEEAEELGRAIASESEERVAAEAGDVLYHLMVGLASRGVPLRAVLAALARRFGTSGHAEKAARSTGG
jgi:phosphoribosyl-ATP pyrophosphohydrolase/phosphoribosyl-AMP cyclohydrolase